MVNGIQIADLKRPAILFCLGWAAVMLSLIVSIPPVWNTFIHLWRVELAASVFLTGTLAAAYYFNRAQNFRSNISGDEIKLVVVPICALIAWSAISSLWAPSWRSAIHHSLIWSEYLIFYIIVRHLLDRSGSYRHLLNTVGGTLAFLSILAIVSYCAFLVFGGGTSIGIIYAKYGEQVNTVFPVLMVGVLRAKRKRFVVGLAGLAFLWLLIFCSLSRTNLILFAAGTLATGMFVLAIKKLRRYRLRMAIIVATILLAPLPLHLFSMLGTDAGIPFVKRVSNETGISSSNNFRKLMMSISFEMISANPIVGVGADNFGFEANKYRVIYAARHPNDPNLGEAEDTIPERAHNEYLQIAAELGIVGVAIFLWFLIGIGSIAIKGLVRRPSFSIFAVASLIGLVMFLASSLVTSYSFRLIQNGFVFFFVLAVAITRLSQKRALKDDAVSFVTKPGTLRLCYGFGALASVMLVAYCALRVSSVIYETSASSNQNLDDAIPLYKTAMSIDNENPEAPYFLGLRLMDNGKYQEAAYYLRESIGIGKARSADFSYLATAQSLAGDNTGAEETFAEAVAMYPRSAFVLTRYAALLRADGKERECNAQLDRSTRINPEQTNTWWTMLTENPKAAADLANRRRDYVPLMDLQPQISMYAVRAERQIRHPEEKFKF